MQTKTWKAFVPGGLSSFFEICDTAKNGTPITDLEKVGARGGGFGLQKGVTTEVNVTEAKARKIDVFINGKKALNAETTKTVAKMMLDKAETEYEVVIKHGVELPIGAGFGTSAGGALGTALALSKALDLNLTFNQIGKIAHVAEVKCRTGLGTVGPLMLSGCVLTVKPGAPGTAVIDRIPISEDYVIVAGVYGPILTKSVLSSPKVKAAVNRWGKKTLDSILLKPSLENFFVHCRDFAEKTGFLNERLRYLMKLADEAGAIGCAQNMVGEAVHALTTIDDSARLANAFKRVLPEANVIVSRVDLRGSRLLS